MAAQSRLDSFKSLYFGLASAEAEVEDEAGTERFLRTYYDRWNLRSTLSSQRFFLVIGPKGSGKSAINIFVGLQLIKKYGHESVFLKGLNLDEVAPGIQPLSAITQKLASEASTHLTDSAWRLFLSLRFFELLLKDESCSLGRDPQVLRLRDDLRRAGLAGSDFPSVLRRVRENKTAIKLKGTLGQEWSSKETDDVPVTSLGEALLNLIVEAETDNHFMLSIDGLDRIIGDNPGYWVSLAALLRVGDDLHKKLRRAKSDLRLLIMCRSDVFRRIKFADSDKIASDATLYVDWEAEQSVAADSILWDYLGAKAEVATGPLLAHFPAEMVVGKKAGRPRSLNTLTYIIESTRCTPREMTMLMRRIQDEVPHHGFITQDRLRIAVDKFSSRDLLQVVAAEATGLLQTEIQDKLDDIISSIPFAKNLHEPDLTKALKSADVDTSLTKDLAEFLFMAGLLGNYDPRNGYVNFYHRRNTNKFKRSGPWILHRGLMYAYTVPYTDPEKSVNLVETAWSSTTTS